jgi:transmembrane sensor
MYNDRFAQLMARQLSGEASEEEILELRHFLKHNPQAHYFFEVFSDYWSLQPSKADDGILDEVHFQQIISLAEKQPAEELPQPTEVAEEEIPVRQAPIISFKKLLAAAVFIGVLLVSYYLWMRPSSPVQPEIAYNEVIAQKGIRSYLILPDGTKVWLNSESKLTYEGNFNDTIREVSLEGEAFFDVVTDKKRPFVVHTSDINIRVLGTAFNVKSYPKESIIEATLIHGLIEVTKVKEPTSPKVILRPHQKLVFSRDTVHQGDKLTAEAKSIPVHTPFATIALPRNKPDSALVETSWVYDKLIFDGESFREIARKMERWYNVTINFQSEEVASALIHVEFKDENLEEALRALQVIEPFHYTKTGNQIEILKK